MFPIQCATVVELRLQKMGEFYEKPHFTIEKFEISGSCKVGVKNVCTELSKPHPYAKSGRTNRLAYVAVTSF